MERICFFFIQAVLRLWICIPLCSLTDFYTLPVNSIDSDACLKNQHTPPTELYRDSLDFFRFYGDLLNF